LGNLRPEPTLRTTVFPIRLRLRSKLLAGFAALAVLTAALGGYALLALERTNQSRQTVTVDAFGGAYLMARYIDQGWTARTATVRYLDAETPDEREAARQWMVRLDSSIAELVDQLRTTDTGASERDNLERVIAAQAAYVSWRDGSLIPAVDAGDLAGARAGYMSEGRRLGVEWNRAAADFLELERASAAGISSGGQADYELSRAVTVGFLLAAPLLALLIGIRLSKSIGGRVGRAAAAAKALARGDLDQSFEGADPSGDEIDAMLAAFQEMVNYLQGMADMAAVADAVARGEMTTDVQPVSERDVLGRAFQHMLRSLRRLVAQMQAQAQELGEQAQLLELARDAIIVRDFATNQILFWNRGAEAMYGWDRRTAHGKVTHTLLGTTFSSSPQAVDDVLGRTGHWEGELGHRRKDGSRIVVASRQVVQCDAAGQPVATLEINTDVTARLQAEQAHRHLASIVESSADAIVGMSPDGTIQSWNRGAERLFGYSADEVLGENVARLVPPDQLDELKALHERVRQDERIESVETVHVARDGRRIDVSLSLAPIKDARGEIVGMAGVVRDATERRMVDRMKDEFVSVVSHELRTPLTSIRGSLGLLAGGVLGPLPDKGQRMVEIAVANTDRLIRLINDILDLERMSSGKVNMQRQSCDAGELVVQAGDVMRPLAEKAGVALLVSPISATLWADPDRLLQTFTNLLSNAIKFSPAGSVVRFSAERQANQVVFSVRDQGRGIPADKLDTIFERFQQVDASDARQKGGTGLGLAISKMIVEQHDGRIWAESELGVGATLWVSLPAHDEPSYAESGAPLGDRPVVLVCDDEPSILEVVRILLDQRGYHAVGVTSGPEAIARAAELQPAAILLDLMMPGMDGWDTLASLKERLDTRDIPVIIFSALEPPAEVAGRQDAAGWLSKPLDTEALFKALQRVAARPGRVGRVLLVEDDLDLAGVLGELFAQRGLELHHAKTGRQAVELAQRLNPDLMLLDLGLPDTDGFRVVDWLRRHDRLRRMPLVVYTARDLEPADRERLRLGPTEFLTKARTSPQECERRVLTILDRLLPSSDLLDRKAS
jgi:PAS domain S-box-containing protein